MKKRSFAVIFVAVLISVVTVLAYSSENGQTNNPSVSDVSGPWLYRNLLGTWNIQNYNYNDYYQEGTGMIRIYKGGTFDLISGSFAAIGMGSGTGSSAPYCTHIQENQTYQIWPGALVAFSYYIPDGNTTYHYSVIPLVIKHNRDKIVFLGRGGCNRADWQSISVLTRLTF